MSSLPLVTIMIPAYNQADMVGLAIDSALAQDYERLEVIVSDDCSQDATEDEVKKFQSDPRFRYFRHAENLGRVANYKYCLENWANGDWVVNLDADDHYTDPSFISKAIKCIQEHDTDKIVFLQAGHTVQTSSGKVIRKDLPDIPGSTKMISGVEYFLHFHHFSHLATLYHRESAIMLDFYRYNILSSDIESILRLALHGNVVLMRDSVGVWHHHGANSSMRLNKDLVELNMLRIEAPYICAKTMGLISPPELLRWKNRMTNAYLMHYLSIYIKNPKALPGYWKHVCRYYPQVLISRTFPRIVIAAVLGRIRQAFGKSKN